MMVVLTNLIHTNRNIKIQRNKVGREDNSDFYTIARERKRQIGREREKEKERLFLFFFRSANHRYLQHLTLNIYLILF